MQPTRPRSTLPSTLLTAAVAAVLAVLAALAPIPTQGAEPTAPDSASFRR